MADLGFAVKTQKKFKLQVSYQPVKFGGGYIMVLGCITPNAVGPIVKIDGKMNKDQNLEILRNNLPVAI